MEVTRERVVEALRGVVDPELGKDIVEAGFVRDLRIGGGRVDVTIELTTPACPIRGLFQKQVEDAIRRVDGVHEVRVEMTARVRPSRKNEDWLPQVRNVVVVSSGKGGVGKTTVAVGIAAAWAADGARVGLLDLDVWGPNVPAMLGAEGPLEARAGKILPIRRHGIASMSVGYFLREGEPVMWRGPMAHGALRQFCRDVEWGELDYLVCDMPPGTGDVPMSVAQTLRPAGAVVVATPQRVALLDVEKSVRMFEKMGVPVLGIVENMTTLICPHCGGEVDVFGRGGAEEAAARWGVAFLGRVPFDPAVRAHGDGGTPLVVAQPEHPASVALRAVARAAAHRLSVVVERSDRGTGE